MKEVIAPRKKIPTLLKRLAERKPERLDYIGTSFGLTKELLKFWKSQKFVPVYLSQKANDLTGEYSTILISSLNTKKTDTKNWLSMYYYDFRRRFMKLLAKTFQDFSTGLALSVLDNDAVAMKSDVLTKDIIDTYFIPHDLQRLESYFRNQVEYRLVLDVTSDISRLFFEGRIVESEIKPSQKAMLLGIGLQNRPAEKVAEEFGWPAEQVLSNLRDCLKKLAKKLENVLESNIEKTMLRESELDTGKSMVPTAQTFNEELERDAKELERKQKKELKRLKDENLAAYAIKGTESDWGAALAKGKTSVISVKR